MQEEVENRTLTLVVSGTKFTGRMFKAAISKPPMRNTRLTCAAMHRTSALPMSIWVKAVQKPSSRQMLMPFVC